MLKATDPPETLPPPYARDTASAQCSTFTGIIPVWTKILIPQEWYWYLVFESGI